MARQDFLNAQELVDRLNKEFDKHRNIIEATAESVQKLQGEYKKLPSDYLKIQREIQNTLKAQANAETALIKTKQQSEKLTQDQIRSAKARLALSQQETKAAEARANAEAKAVQKAIKESEKLIAQKEKEFKAFEKEFNKYEADLRRKEIAEAKAALATQKNAEKQRIAEIQLNKAREQAFAKYDSQLKKQQASEAKANAELAKAENVYNKVQAKVNSLVGTYNNIAAKRELGIKLTTREEAQLLSLEKRLTKYNTVLKNVDAGIGKYHRNVGNYASGNAQLSMAIGQFSRELPNAGISFQTFAMSLSNQFGQLQDAIAQTVAQNKILIAQGQPVKRVGAQILSSFLSLNTAMYIGIALFTAYGKEIGDFFGKLFEGSKVLDAAKDSMEALNAIRLESAKAIVQERVELQNNIKTAQDVNLTYKEREIAADKILKQYPFWFENLGKEAIMNGDVKEAIEGVNAALLARAKSAAATTKITENQSRIIDLEEEIRLEKEKQKQLEINAEREARLATRNLTTSTRETADVVNTTRVQRATDELAASKRKLAKDQEELNYLNDKNARLLGYTATEYEKSIGLDYQKAESTKMATEALADFEASNYELIKTRLENEANSLKLMMENEEVNLDQRQRAYQRYHEILARLEGNRYSEEKRLLDQSLNDEIARLDKRVKDGEISERNRNAVVFSLQKQHTYDSALLYTNYVEGLKQVNGSLSDSMKGVWDKINFQKGESIIAEKDLKLNQQYVGSLREIIEGNKDYQEIDKANKKFQEASRELTKDAIANDILALETERARLSDHEDNVQKRLELDEQIAQKQKELTQVTLQETQEQAAALEKLQKATENYLKSFVTDPLNEWGLESLNTFLKVEENGKSMFENLIAGANTASEKFAVMFNTITEVAQEAYAFMNQNAQAHFDAQYSMLERERDIAIQFAGESEAGRAEVERQYEERRREIRIREDKAQKEQALFNAIINTAQAVVAALPNIPLSVIVGALGAAQIAMIASRPIPAYAEGTDNHEGGLMLVNDAKGSNYRELIKTPDGKTFMPKGRNVLMDAPKGTQVLKAGTFDRELNDLLQQNSIAPFAATLLRDTYGMMSVNSGGGLTKEDATEAFKTALNSLAIVNNKFDENGYHSSIKKGNAITNNLNAVKTSKGITLR